MDPRHQCWHWVSLKKRNKLQRHPLRVLLYMSAERAIITLRNRQERGANMALIFELILLAVFLTAFIYTFRTVRKV